jgi:hypothetical protein
MAMKFLTRSIVIGLLIQVGSLPAASAQQPAPTGGASTDDRTAYTMKAREEMQSWDQKLHDFSARAAAKGKEVGNATERDLNRAWVKADAAARELQTATAREWTRARNSFERASHDLSETWNRSHAEND